MFARR